MKLEMGIFSPSSYLSTTDWLIEESRNNNTQWTPEENKIFENALAVYDKDSPDRWHKIADMIPGKTVHDVVKQYRELEDDVNNIEAGLIPIPGYKNKGSTFAFDWDNNCNSFDGFKQSFGFGAKRSSCLARPADHERKKGVPWTEEEHKLFLMGLKKYGKGDWRNISRNFVVTRTPTQVASHAQKYFIRQLSGGKDKRRASIHDITTVNLNELISSSPDKKRQASPDQSVAFSRQRNGVAFPGMHFQLNQPNSRAAIAFNSTRGNMFMSSHSINSYELKMQGCTLRRGPVHDSYVGPQSTAFQMQSAQYEPY